MLKRFTWLAAGAATLLSSCSDPKDANKENFKDAINDWIKEHPPCIPVPRGQITPSQDSGAEFPRYVEATPVTSKFAQESRAREEAPFLALVDAGLMTVKDATIPVRASLFGDGQKQVPVRSYDLSEKGKKIVTAQGDKTAFSSPAQRFCYGTPTVDEIVQYTEPADAMGVKVSQVTYRYHLKDLPDWARNEKLKVAYPELERNAAESLDGKAAVILTNEGWVHERASSAR
ncbi:hypothetical protein [Sphingobium sp.]|uniref:hypothetical protein n=1 Tax=Sphingobium sp. TaxID=1912891 RepID=UPI000DB49F0B|nr:hypothetical protein [Sphingobium sp.]PZU68655.1 MAG: hypothetical protein DI540_07855 [Sphingobium sp.]